MNYKIIQSQFSLFDLSKQVSAATDYEPTGGPFRDPDSRMWCQAVVLKRIPTDTTEIRLREPKGKR